MPAVDLLAGVAAFTLGGLAGRTSEARPMPPRFSRWVVVLVGAALAAATSTSHSTANGGAEVAWRFFLVVALASTAIRANRTFLLAGGVVAAVVAPLGLTWLGFAAIGLVVAGDTAVARAAAGALIGAAMLHADWPGGTGRTAVLAGALLLVLVATTGRRFAGRAALAAVAVVAGLGLAAGAAALVLGGQRADAQAAIDAGEAGLDAARSGDSAAAAAHFSDAERLLRRMRAEVRSWRVAPARAVPVLGANLRAAEDLLAVAETIAASGVDTARAADLDRLSPTDGSIDLAALRSFDAPLQALGTTLDGATTALRRPGSPWTVGPIHERVDDLAGKVTRARADARRAGRAVDALPGLLGGDGTRRYFLAVMTPAELRAGGGFVGNWGILEAADGRVSLPRFGRIADLYRDEPYRIEVDPDYDRRYGEYFKLARFPQNILSSPDLPANALAISQILDQAGEGQVDGIITVDPIAMAALLELTGPLDVEGWDGPLTSANVAEALLFRQYEHAADPRRPELLARTTQTLFQRLTTGALPAVDTIADTLGPAVEAGHLQFASLHPEDHAVLDDARLQHELPPVEDGGFVVVGNSSVASKLDWFLRREVDYDITVDRDGSTTATVTVTVQNTARAADLPDEYYEYKAGGLAKGVNGQDVSVYTSLDLVDATIDGAPTHVNPWQEQGWNVFDTFVVVPPSDKRTIVLHLRGRAPVRQGRYRLRLEPQPTVSPDEVRVRINGRELFAGPLDHPIHLASPLG